MASTAPNPYTPCNVEDWVTLDAAQQCGSFCKDFNPDDPEVAEQVEALMAFAAEWFYMRTGFMYPGCCDHEDTPCWDRCDPCGSDTKSGKVFDVVIRDGVFYNVNCGCDAVDCCHREKIPLFPGPVHEITEVIVDGVPLPQFNDNGDKVWRLDEWKYLVRCDGGTWPNCNNPCNPEFIVKYRAGAQPPPILQRCAALFARELICQCFCPAKCRLPPYWETISRDGMTMRNRAVTDTQITSSLLGLDPLCDQTLMMFSLPSGKPYRRRARVLSPDLPPMGKRNWDV